MPRVSIIAPAYKHEKYVAEAVQSVLDQSYSDFEFFVVDDGSPDKTFEIMSRFSDPRFHASAFEKNIGPVFATEKALSQTTGEYIANLATDDAFYPHKIEAQVAYLDAHPEVGAVFSNATIMDDDGQEYPDKNHFYCNIFNQPNRSRYEWLNHFFYHGNCLCHSSMLIRRSCKEKVGPYDRRLFQLCDFEYWIRVCLQAEIHIIPEPLLKFRILANSGNSSAPTTQATIRHRWEMKHILRHYLNLKPFETFLRVFPDARKYGEDIPDHLIPFVFAKVCLETQEPSHISFALDLLYELLADRQLASEIEGRFGFTNKEFIALTGTDNEALWKRVAFRQGIIDDLFTAPLWKAPLKYLVQKRDYDKRYKRKS